VSGKQQELKLERVLIVFSLRKYNALMRITAKVGKQVPMPGGTKKSPVVETTGLCLSIPKLARGQRQD
jgi:hypothetical protein